jgi:gluconolactonase
MGLAPWASFKRSPIVALNSLTVRESPSDFLESGAPERIAGGFVFTEGPLWDPRGFLWFVDIRANRLYRMRPGSAPEVVRENTGGGNGLAFDLDGNLVMCEGFNRRVTRMNADGEVTVLAERFEGRRLNRPNDVVCRSDGSIYFTDPGLRMDIRERELYAAVYRITRAGGLELVVDVEYPNGLAFTADEKILYVANTRWTQYIHAIEMDDAGRMKRRRIFADMSYEGNERFPEAGFPDGMKVDEAGRVFCTGNGGVWVFAPDGTKLGVIPCAEVAANLAFGGADMRTLYFTAHTSLYSMRVKTPGLKQPWQKAHMP